MVTTLLSYYITDAERAPGGFKAFVKLTSEQGRQVAIRSTLPAVVEPELSEPTEWCLQLFLPFTLLEAQGNRVNAARRADADSECNRVIELMPVHYAAAL